MNQKRSAADKRKVVVAIGVSLLAIVLVSFLVQFYQGKTVVGKAVGQTVCPGGTVAWWKGEGNVFDSSGTNNGNWIGVTAYQQGKVGQAFDFDGTNYVSVINNDALNILGPLTIEGWVKRGNSGVLQTIVKKRISSSGYSILILNNNKIRFVINNVVAETNLDINSVFPADSYHHLAAVFNPNQYMKIYIDGNEFFSSIGDFDVPLSISANTENFYIGKNTENPHFVGGVDELSIYNRALSQQEIQSIYNAGGVGKCLVNENCNSDQDDDNDGKTNCFDTDCYTDADCASQPCDAGKTVAWSFQYPNEGTVTAPERAGCCKNNECYDDGNCVGFGTEDTDGQLCDTDRNWYKCETDGPLSRDGKFRCAGQVWEVVCSLATKYKLEDGDDTNTLADDKICDGQQFQTCPNAPLLSNLFVGVTCDNLNNITVTELICNNGLDDDNDGDIDTDDTDCPAASLDFLLNGTTHYEVIIKATDTFKLNIKK